MANLLWVKICTLLVFPIFWTIFELLSETKIALKSKNYSIGLRVGKWLLIQLSYWKVGLNNPGFEKSGFHCLLLIKWHHRDARQDFIHKNVWLQIPKLFFHTIWTLNQGSRALDCTMLQISMIREFQKKLKLH